MKKSLTYLTEQVKTRLANSMLLFAEQKYKNLKKSYTKYIKVSSIPVSCSIIGIIWSSLYEVAPQVPIVGCLSLTIFTLTFLFFLNYIAELKNLLKREKIFMHTHISSEAALIEKFNELFNKEFSYERISSLTGYSWIDFNINLTNEEIKYLMNTELTPEQFGVLKETLISKSNLDFFSLIKLTTKTEIELNQQNEILTNFINNHNLQNATVAKRYIQQEEKELEIAYNKYI